MYSVFKAVTTTIVKKAVPYARAAGFANAKCCPLFILMEAEDPRCSEAHRRDECRPGKIKQLNNNPAFVLARPPGHHACKSSGGGDCLFSNAAIAAYYALEQPNINRVAILDWDVHHGNGTETIIENNPNIAYCSLHQSPCYPGTGKASDRGKYNNVLNIPMLPGSTFDIYQVAFENFVFPFLRNFNPDLLIVSAGYDANHDDLISAISLQPRDFGIFTQFLLKINRRVLFGLEGGYEPNSLSKSVVATVEACLEFCGKNN